MRIGLIVGLLYLSSCGRWGFDATDPANSAIDAAPGCGTGCSDAGVLRIFPEADISFGDGDGLVTFAGGNVNHNQAVAVDLDSTGRLVVAGEMNPTGSNREMALWRLESTGALDSTFVGGGQLLVDASPYDWARQVHVLPNEQILVGGNIDYGRDNPTLWRFTSGGGLDPTFGSSGRVYINISGEVQGQGSAVDERTGNYLVFGTQYDNWTVVSRILESGGVDTTFAGGRVVLNGIPKLFCPRVTVDTQGRVLLLGSARPGGDTSDKDLVLIRLLEDGAMDASFGNDGVVLLDGALGTAASSETGTNFALDAAGDIYVVGLGDEGANTQSQVLLWKFSGSDGALVTSFGQNGQALVSSQGRAATVVVKPDGLLVVGHAQGTTNTDITIWRLTMDGSLDTRFDDDGHYSMDLPGSSEYVNSAIFDAEGKAIVVGKTTLEGETQSAAFVVRLALVEGL